MNNIVDSSVTVAPVVSETAPTTAPASPAKSKQAAKQKALRAALGAFAAEAGIASQRGSADRSLARIEMLRLGVVEKNGKSKKLSFAQTATEVLKLCRSGFADRIPAEVRARFPWGAVSEQTLADVAEAGGVDLATFRLAIGLAPVELKAAEPVELEAPAPSAPAVVDIKRGSRRR